MYFRGLLDMPEASMAVLAHYVQHPRWDRVDFITGIGLSGTMPLLGLRMAGWNVLALRKQVSSHGAITYHPKEGMRYLIVDDFVHTGGTIAKVMKDPLLLNCECAGALFYMSHSEPQVRDLPTMGVYREVLEVDKLVGQGYEL